MERHLAAGKDRHFMNCMRGEVPDVNIRKITLNDQISDFPEAHNENMAEVEKAINSIMFEIARLRDDIAHLKIMIRED